MQELIHVIVPVYNVAPYIDHCVQSIINQTYKNLNIILVDDGSTDESGKKCDDWTKKDTRIHVIHQSNCGLSGARNTGLSAINCGLSKTRNENKSTSFVTFWDSDDWTEPDILKNAINIITSKNADMVVWGYRADFVNENEIVINSKEYMVPNCLIKNGLTKDTIIYDEVRAIHGYAWNKLYRTSFIMKNRLVFPLGIYLIEDMLFNLEVLKYGAKTVYLPDVATHYIQRKRETLGTKYHPDNFVLQCNSINGWIEVFKQFNVDTNTICDYRCKAQFEAVMSTIRAIVKAKIFTSEIKKKMINDFLLKDETKSFLCEYIPESFKERILYFICLHRMVNLLILIYC